MVANSHDLVELLGLSEHQSKAIHSTFTTLPSEIRERWFSSLSVEEGQIKGTQYSDIGSYITYNQFVTLYEALGYDFQRTTTWQDWWCYGALGCTRKSGYTCDPNNCP